jgi:hypothetical protein
LVNDLHLFHNGRLATFPGACGTGLAHVQGS